MIGHRLRQPRPVSPPVRIDLDSGDVEAIEVIEDGDCVQLVLYDKCHSAVPITIALLSREKRRLLVAALLTVDMAPVSGKKEP